MKSKKLKKLAKKIHDEVSRCEKLKRENDCAKISESHYTEDWSNYDVDVSEKFKKMVINLANYKNNIHVSIDNNRIYISTGDVKTIKTGTKSKTLSNEENYLELSIYKNSGFTLNYGYKFKSNYKDIKIYDELFQIVSEKLREINASNFDEAWCNLMKDSGVLRDNNINDLLE